MNVGLLGGSFDPPHRGHVALARLALIRLNLDRVLFAPVGVQPLKQDAAPAAFEDRVAMVRLAIAGQPKMEVSLIDAPRPDHRPNYSLDTVRRLRRELGPEPCLFSLMGADSFLTIGKWHRAAELLMACDFAVAARPGFDLGRIAGALPESISVAAEEQEQPDTLVLGLRGKDHRRSRLYLLTDLADDTSATEIRAALSSGVHVNAVLQPAVAEYICRHRLYRRS